MLAHSASHWYTHLASGTSLTVILIVATLAIIGQAYYYRRVGSPRPVIVYRMSRPTLLVASRLLRDAAGEVEVTFKGDPVAEPHTAALTLECKGRRDITDEDFYRHRPLVFDIGARIVTLLYSDSERTKISPENLATDGAKAASRAVPDTPRTCAQHRGSDGRRAEAELQ